MSDVKTLALEKSKLEQQLARLRIKLAGRDELLRRLRSEQQWSTEALAAVHVPLMAFNDAGVLVWLNEAAKNLLGLTIVGDNAVTDDLPQRLRQLLQEQFAQAQQKPPIETGGIAQSPRHALTKLHGQGYRVAMQFLPNGSAANQLQTQHISGTHAQWLVSLVPEQGDVVAQAVGYPELPEIGRGVDGGGAMSFGIELNGHELALEFQPVLALAQFLGTEQLARLQYRAEPSVELDLALVKSLSERAISDRLGALAAGAWMIRLSDDTIHDRDFASKVISILNQYQLQGTRFIFGVSETEVMDALVLVRQLQADLAHMGIRWALVDTSADLNNFEYLAPLGFDFYCINPDLVAQAGEQERARHVLHALHEAATGQGMATLATAVDSAEIMSAVRATGVDYASGQWASHEATY